MKQRPGYTTLLLSLMTAQLFAAEPAATTSAPASRPTRPRDLVNSATISPWQPIFKGIELCKASMTSPRMLQLRAVRIDLKEPTIDFLVTPSNGDQPKDCGARTTMQFLTEFKCQLAINGSYFDVLADKDGTPQDVEGLSLSRGDMYSPPGDKFDALLISKEHKAWIALAPVDCADAYNGLAGHQALVLLGRICVDPNLSPAFTGPNPRTTAGISKDGRYLILMVIDGRQPGWSEGTTLYETAEWMRKLGAYDAINFDGGGSTAMVIEGPDGKPEELNRPSGKVERRVANHLGVYAKRK